MTISRCIYFQSSHDNAFVGIGMLFYFFAPWWHKSLYIYRQTSNIRRPLLGNNIFGQSYASRCCSNYIFIIYLTTGFNWMCKGTCKTGRETFRFWNLMRLILQVWRYLLLLQQTPVPVCGTNPANWFRFRLHNNRTQVSLTWEFRLIGNRHVGCNIQARANLNGSVRYQV